MILHQYIPCATAAAQTGGGETEANMPQISLDILALTSEAAMLVQRGKVVFANSAACGLLGDKCIGKTVRDIFGADISGTQASSFLADTSIAGKRCIVRVSKLEQEQVIFFSCADSSPVILNDPFLCTIRNSLMTIGMSADRIREKAEAVGDDCVLSNIADLTRSYYRIIRMIANASLVLNMAQGNMPFGPCVINISALCQSVVDSVCHFSSLPAFSLNLGSDIAINADPSLIKQLLLNLISNCLSHAEGCTKISISLIDTSDSVILSVSDNGHGIPREQLHTVFDRYRHGFDIVGMGVGAGLGLTVVRCIAQLHGGAVMLESREEQGTTVRVTLSKVSDAAILHSPQEAGPDSRHSVLIGLSDCLPPECYTQNRRI